MTDNIENQIGKKTIAKLETQKKKLKKDSPVVRYERLEGELLDFIEETIVSARQLLKHPPEDPAIVHSKVATINASCKVIGLCFDISHHELAANRLIEQQLSLNIN